MKKLSQILLLTLVVVTLVSAFVFSASAATYTIKDAATFEKYMYDETLWEGEHTYNVTASFSISSLDQKPIGTNATPFRGTIRGWDASTSKLATRTISGVNISAENYAGLFGVTANAEIKNLTVSGTVKATIAADGSARTGGLVGMSRGDLTIDSVTNKINVTANGNNVGGFIGLVSFNDTDSTNVVTIDGCANDGTIKGGKYVGGFVGALGGSEAYSQAGTLKITNSHNRGDVTSTGNCAAGFFGYFNFVGTSDSASGDLYIARCTNVGTIKSGDGFAGGIIAAYLPSCNTKASDITLEIVQNRGKVSARYSAGAIMGAFRMPKSNEETLRDWLNCGLSTNLPMIGFVTDETTKTSKLTLAGLYNKAGQKIIGNTGTTTGKYTKGTLTVEFINCCNKDSTQAELSVLPTRVIGDVARWTTGVDDTVWLSEWNHTAHEFENGTCAYCGMTITDGLIGTPAELLALMNTSSLWGKNYKLIADIDLTGYTTTNLTTQEPIGDAKTKFTGSFNGNGYTVSGVNISETDYVGFFGITDGATIKNLTLNGKVTGTRYVGGFVGDARIREGASTTIENCVSNLTVTSTGENAKLTGGFVGVVRYVGDNASFTIKNCVNNKAVTGVSNVGGIVGYVWSDNINEVYYSGCSFSASNCYNYGDVKATKSSAGGIIGVCQYNCPDGGRFQLNKCANYGAITSASDRAGGIMATFLGSSNAYGISTTMTELYNAGEVTVTTDNGYHGSIIGVFRVPKLDESGKTPVKIADIQNTSGTLGLIGTIGDPNGIFTIARAYNTNGTDIIDANPGIVNTSPSASIVDSMGYQLTLMENYNSKSNATELALLIDADKWVADKAGKPELEFVHEHDFSGDGVCSCAASVLDEEIEFPEEIIFLMNNQTVGSENLMAKNYKLIKNIDLTGYDNQKPIAPNSSKSYIGTFDGNGYTITGINISTDSANTGLFAHAIGATIKNLTIRGTVSSTSGNNVGGLVGYGRKLNVSNCTSYVNVTGSGVWTGGIVGYLTNATSQTSTVDNCVNYGTISGSVRSGGIVGGVGVGNENISFNITNCKNYGKVTSSSTYAGGIIGYVVCTATTGENTLTVNKCANYGNITAPQHVGGIVGGHLPWVDIGGTGFYAAALAATYSELLNTGVITVTNTAYVNRMGGIIGMIAIPSEATSVTMTDLMHMGATVSGTAHQDIGLVGALGLPSTTTGVEKTVTIANTYNAAGLVTVKNTREYITVDASMQSNTSTSIDGLVTLAAESNWVNEGTAEAPAPMLKAFHEHDFTSGVCPCGTKFDYKISNVEEMLIYMHNPSLWSHDCVLDANIDLTGVAGQNPVGTDETPYTGTFDGKNFTVTGLSINGTEAGAGLFGVVKNATIKNVKLVNPTVSGTDGAGALIGTAYAPITVSGCTVENATVTATFNAGGVIGDILFSAASKTVDVRNCTATGGNITATAHAGGIIGRIRTATDRYTTESAVAGGSVTVSGCTSSATVYADHYDQADAGGIVGRITVFSANNVIKISGNKNTGTVSGTTCIGGIIGRFNVSDNDSTVHLTGNVVTVSENTNTGAITASYDFAGGIAGVVNNTEDTELFFSGKTGVTTNTGTITAGAYAGGVMGAYYNRGYFIATKTQTVTLLKNTGKVTAIADADYAGSQASRSAGGIIGLISTTSTPVNISVLENQGDVHADYAYSGGIVGYIRNYGNENASLTLTDTRSKGTVTTNYKYAGGIVGCATGDGPLSVYYNASSSDVKGGESSVSSTVNACFGDVIDHDDHNIHSNFYGKNSLQAGKRAHYLNPATNKDTTVAVAVEKMVARSAWVVGAGAVPYLEAFTNDCGSGHVENDAKDDGEGWIWHYDSSAKQYYLTCTACGLPYAHQSEAPTLYVGSSLRVGIDTNIGTTPETKLRTLEEAARRLAETGGTIRVSGGIAMDESVTLPDWGDNTITFTSDPADHDAYGAVTTGILIKKMDVQLNLGGKAIFDDILFKANDANNYRIIISANWHDIEMRYVRAQNNARCYLLAGTYGERSTSENLDKTVTTNIKIDGPALTESQTIGYFYERIYLGSAPLHENLTIKNKTVNLTVQDGYTNTKATTRTQPALIYFLYAMSTADMTQNVFTDGCTSNIYLNDNSMVHAFSTGSRNVGEE